MEKLTLTAFVFSGPPPPVDAVEVPWPSTAVAAIRTTPEPWPVQHHPGSWAWAGTAPDDDMVVITMVVITITIITTMELALGGHRRTLPKGVSSRSAATRALWTAWAAARVR